MGAKTYKIPQKFAVFDQDHDIPKAGLLNKLDNQNTKNLLGGVVPFTSFAGLGEQFGQVLMDQRNQPRVLVQQHRKLVVFLPVCVHDF